MQRGASGLRQPVGVPRERSSLDATKDINRYWVRGRGRADQGLLMGITLKDAASCSLVKVGYLLRVLEEAGTVLLNKDVLFA